MKNNSPIVPVFCVIIFPTFGTTFSQLFFDSLYMLSQTHIQKPCEPVIFFAPNLGDCYSN